MSSTERAQALERFFREELVPLADRLRARTVDPVAQTATGEAASWFVTRGVPAEMTELSLEPSALAAEWARLCAASWGEGADDVRELVARLAALAPLFADTQERAEVSPLIYAMF